MAFKIGLVGLCTSHPENWVPIIRDMAAAGTADVEVAAAWDSGETRQDGFAKEFCRKFDVPACPEDLEDMVDMVDGVIVHSANWDKHIEQVSPFIAADKSVLIDKPIVGNRRDADQLLEWARQGKRITGGSSLRFAGEVAEFLSKPVRERGTVHTAHSVCGVDEFNYGIHAYSLLSCAMGTGVRSAVHLGSHTQRHVKVTWEDGRIGLVTVGEVSDWLPFGVMLVTDRKIKQITVDSGSIYRCLLEAALPYLCGEQENPPLSVQELLEPELAAMAARVSRLNGDAEVLLCDLSADDPGYDGTEFAREYRRAREKK